MQNKFGNDASATIKSVIDKRLSIETAQIKPEVNKSFTNDNMLFIGSDEYWEGNRETLIAKI